MRKKFGERGCKYFAMKGESSWVSHYTDHLTRNSAEFDWYSKYQYEDDREVNSVSLDILPYDLLERILAHLPVASILRARSVCRKWNEIVSSKGFLCNYSCPRSHKPWYFMLTNSDNPESYAYDPNHHKWYNIPLPCVNVCNYFASSSYGLVCFMSNHKWGSQLFVCNPITNSWRTLVQPPGPRVSYHTALALSVDSASHSYIISIIKCHDVPPDHKQWAISLYVYESRTMRWTTVLTETLNGWRAGEESVIIDGVLYVMVYSVGGVDKRHGLVTYDLGRQPEHETLMRSFVPVPFSLSRTRLMNLKGKLVMVGGMCKPDRPGSVKGIGIWVLRGRAWQEVARMPNKYFHGFGEFDEFFCGSGAGDLVYIQSYGSAALLSFDLNRKQWKWAQKHPALKKFFLHIFTGFCLQPRLDVSS